MNEKNRQIQLTELSSVRNYVLAQPFDEIVSDRSVVDADGLVRYIAFKIGDRDFGFELDKLCVITSAREITKLSRKSKFVRGIIWVTGNVIPVVNLNEKLNLSASKEYSEAFILVIHYKGIKLGVVVEKLPEISSTSKNEIVDISNYDLDIKPEYVLSICKKNGNYGILLDIDQILTKNDIEDIHYAVMEGQIVSSTTSPHG